MLKFSELLRCGLCNTPLVLNMSRFGPYYSCLHCRGTGVTSNGRTINVRPSRATRHARRQAHQVLDGLVAAGIMTRTDAYKLVQKLMGMTPAQAHIGCFNVADCNKLIALLKNIKHEVTATK